uniref:Peptidase M24 domain-containing protein n=1 Tax=Macaca nemestrina TaxID=9545 RepID=A0A2K6BEW5_MACNE
MSGRDEQQEQTMAKDLVVTKYKMGGEGAARCDMANWVLRTLVEASSSGVSVLSLCEKGHAMITEETEKIFKKENISVNNFVCDLVKIDLGFHVDGLIANVAHTFVVDVAQGTQVTGRKADVIKIAHLCAEAALCLTWNKVAHSFNWMPIEGMLSHQLKQHVINGEKNIIQNPTDQQKKDQEKAEFEVHPSKQYELKMKTSRAFFSEVERRFDAMPFTLRAFEDEKKAWMGVVECTKHGLLQPFNVLSEKEGEFVAQFKFAILLMPNGPMQITSGPFEPDLYKSEMEVQDAELKALLQSSASQETQKKKKKKKRLPRLQRMPPVGKH